MEDVVELVDAADGQGVEEKARNEKSHGAGRLVVAVERLGAFEHQRGAVTEKGSRSLEPAVIFARS